MTLGLLLILLMGKNTAPAATRPKIFKIFLSRKHAMMGGIVFVKNAMSSESLFHVFVKRKGLHPMNKQLVQLESPAAVRFALAVGTPELIDPMALTVQAMTCTGCGDTLTGVLEKEAGTCFACILVEDALECALCPGPPYPHVEPLAWTPELAREWKMTKGEGEY